MNSLRASVSRLAGLACPALARSHTYYLTRRRIPIEVLDENYQPKDKMTKLELEAKKLDVKNRDRRVPIPWEMSIKYLESDEYRLAYRGLKVWIPYRRNHRGPVENPPIRTRYTCIHNGFVVVGSPCPICRDRYLIIHPRNVRLLEQFINPASDEVYECSKIQLCEQKYEDLVAAVEIARDRGYMQFKVPFRQFDYSDFYSKELLKDLDGSGDLKLVEDDDVKERAKKILQPTKRPYARVRVPF